MLLLNFSHPLTPEHIQQVEHELGGQISAVATIPTHFDVDRTFIEQVKELADQAGLSITEWQTRQILVNPPAYSVIAVTLLAELHGRMGYFPRVIRMKPNEDDQAPFQVAEIIDLRKVRDKARVRGSGGKPHAG